MKKVSKSILTILTAASVILPSSVFAEPAESEANLNLSAEQQQQYNIEKQYLNDVVHTINTTIGSTEALDEYGELYIDTQTGYKFVLALASTDEKTNQLGEKLKSIVPSEFLEFKSVKYSKSQLDKMRDEIAQDLEGSGVTNYEINTSVKDQKVEVNLERETQARGNTIEALFDTSEIDQSVVDVNYDVVIDAEPALARTANFTTMGGGIAIDNSNCSTAFTATKDTKEFLVTAGHCVTSIGSAAKQNTTNVGTQHLSAYGDYGTDVGLILLTDTSRSIGNGYYYNGLANGEYDKNYTTTTTVINGQLICKSGIKTSVTCGSVTNTSATVTYGTIHLTGMIQAKKDDGGLVLGGDSGGVVFNPYNYGQLIGIVSGRSLATSTLPEGYYGYFTKVGNALANGGAVTLYTSSSTKAVNPNS